MARILVTDDAAFMRMMLKSILLGGGHEVIAEAENGEQAIECYKQHAPDVVTMDITMPLMDGIAAVRSIKESYPQAKILMCSAMGQQSMVMEAVKAGAKGFIVKPFDGTKILAEISRLLA